MTTNSIPPSLRRLRAASGVVLFLLLTGLFPWLAPKGVTAQWVLLAHIVVGLAAIVPLLLIFKRHRRIARNIQPAGRWWSSGSLSWYGWIALCLTGLWLIGAGLWGRFTPYVWHYLHLGIGLAIGAAAAWHLVRGLLKSHFPEHRYREAAAAVIVLGLGLALGGGLVLYARRARPRPRVSFKPSNATTLGGRTIPAALLKGSRACGACHQRIYREWLPGAHHYSATDLFYQAVKANYVRARGAGAVRYCAGCHEPVTLLSGHRLHARTGQRVGAAGQSCAFCHLIRHANSTRGNANYTVIRPTPYLFEHSQNAVLQRVSDLLIRLHPQQHDADYNVRDAQTALYCGTCHKQYLNKQENGWGFVQLQDQYDDWKNGPWHTDPRRNLQCQSCHMPEVRANDPARNAHGFIHDHRILAANDYMPSLLHLPGARRQEQLVNDWMTGQTYIPALASHRWPKGPILPVFLRAEGAFTPGKTVKLQALVVNAKVGHSFPQGPLDVIQSWLQLVVTDRRGRKVYSAGELGPQGQVLGDTVQFRSHLLDRQARPVYTHSLWNVVGARGKLVIPPGGSYAHTFQFQLPRGLAGPLRCELKLLYRKFNSHSQHQLFPVNPPRIPVLVISSTTQYVPLGRNGNLRAGLRARAAVPGRR